MSPPHQNSDIVASKAAGGSVVGPSRTSPIGAEPLAAGTSFRLWAADHAAASVIVEGHGEFALTAEQDGYFTGFVAGVRPPARYQFRLDAGSPLTDPASRWQPDGPDGAS